jgi:antitoxin (DNA-binding transcriptional repressor) of toxin-antitoxin stability system
MDSDTPGLSTPDELRRDGADGSERGGLPGRTSPRRERPSSRLRGGFDVGQLSDDAYWAMMAVSCLTGGLVVPIISIRDLTRGAAAIFEAIKAKPGEPPYIITRNGKPVAALVPIDESQVETLLLSAAPALVRQRDSAANARSEGRTISLDEFLADDDDLDTAAEREVAPIPAQLHAPRAGSWAAVSVGLHRLFGDEMAGYVTDAAYERAVAVTSRAINGMKGLSGTGFNEEAVAPIQQMNQELIVRGVQQEMVSGIGNQLNAIETGAAADPVTSLRDMTGKAQTDLVLDEVTEKVTELNDDFVRSASESEGEFLWSYRAELRAGIETVASQSQLAGPYLR